MVFIAKVAPFDFDKEQLLAPLCDKVNFAKS